MENLTRTVNERMNKLVASEKRFSDIFEIMFSRPEYILSEYTDGYKIIKKTSTAVRWMSFLFIRATSRSCAL